jgi:hypothetical protein
MGKVYIKWFTTENTESTEKGKGFCRRFSDIPQIESSSVLSVVKIR